MHVCAATRREDHGNERLATPFSGGRGRCGGRRITAERLGIGRRRCQRGAEGGIAGWAVDRNGLSQHHARSAGAADRQRHGANCARGGQSLHGQRAGVGIARRRAIAGPGDPGVVRPVRHPPGDSGRVPQARCGPTAGLRHQQAVPGRHAHARLAGDPAGSVRRKGLRRRHATQGVRALDVRADGAGRGPGVGEPRAGGDGVWAEPGRCGAQSPRDVCRRDGQDVRQDRRSAVPPRGRL